MTDTAAQPALGELGACRTEECLSTVATAGGSELIAALEQFADDLRARDLGRAESHVLGLAAEIAQRIRRAEWANDLRIQERLAQARSGPLDTAQALDGALTAARHSPAEGRSSRLLTLIRAAEVLVEQRQPAAAIEAATAAWKQLATEMAAGGGLVPTALKDRPGAVALQGPARLRQLGFELPRTIAFDAPAAAAASLLALQWRTLYTLGWPELATVCLPHLALVLVQLGQAESALEILDEAERALPVIYAPDAVGKPLPEVWLAKEARAAALVSCGRFAEAERVLRSYPGVGAPVVAGARISSAVLALAELFIRTDRSDLALPLLEELPVHDEPRTTVARVRALAGLAYTLLGQTEQAAAAAVAVQQKLPSSAIALGRAAIEAWFGVRMLLAEADLSRGADSAASAREGLAVAESMLGAVEDIRLRTQFEYLQGDLLAADSDPHGALARHSAAFRMMVRPIKQVGWESDWYAGAASVFVDPFAQPLSDLDCERLRVERGVGAALLVRIAEDERAASADNAAAAFDEAIGACTRAGQGSLLYAALTGKASMLRQAGSVDAAADYLRQAIDVLEANRAQLREVSLLLGSTLPPDAVFGILFGEALAKGDNDMAVRLSQRAKSRGLLEEIVSAGHFAGAHVDIATRDRIRRLRTDLVHAMRERTQVNSADAATRVRDLQSQLASTYRRQFRRTPAGPRAAATPDLVASLAAAGTVVLDYFCTEDAIYLSAARDGALLPTRRLPDASAAEVRALLFDLEAECLQRAEPFSLRELGEMLLDPVANVVTGAQRVVVIPHAVLHSVPFAALRNASGRYLIQDCEVVHAPSAAVALQIEAHADAAEPLAAAFGVSRVSYAPLSQIGGVRDEVQELAARVRGLKVVEDATRAELLGIAGELAVLHIACHGEFDAFDPLLSRLYAADGPVYAYDLLGVAAQPRVVVLSGCETGMVETRSGDELFGLVRPFLAAGAACVVAGLWRVSDDSTARLMSELYRAGAPEPATMPGLLRHAQLALLADPATKHVYHWAPWIAIGRGLRS